MPSSVVIAHNGLHALADAYHKGNQQTRDGGEDADGSHSCIATVIKYLVIDDGIDHTTGRVHNAGCSANGKDGIEHLALQAISAWREVDEALLVEEVRHDKHHRGAHGNVGGDSGTLYAPAEPEDEDGRQYHIETGTNEHGDHGLGGIARGTHHIIIRIGEVVEHEARQYPHHEVTRIGQRDIARPEQAQDGIHE